MKQERTKLVLENGMTFSGFGTCTESGVVGEIVFNTAMVGYQEIISDPSYAGQIVVMTYPLIGQYGIIDEDSESKTALFKGLVVRECCETPSNFRFTKTLSEELADRGVCCVSEIDTRMLTAVIRREGRMKAAIVGESTSIEDALRLIRESATDVNWAEKASCANRWFSRTPHHKFDVVIVDCGMKHGIVSELTSRACNVTVLPYGSTAEDVESFNPDGIVISSGPGSHKHHSSIVELIGALKGKYPIFGISLGHELIALSYGAQILDMTSGHHGDYPVRECATGRIITTAQNHNYTVDEASAVACGLTVTHKDVVDGTVEGLECKADRIFSVQFNPEGAPGPRESGLFDKFVKMMEE